MGNTERKRERRKRRRVDKGSSKKVRIMGRIEPHHFSDLSYAPANNHILQMKHNGLFVAHEP
jgi:hypothetical protein